MLIRNDSNRLTWSNATVKAGVDTVDDDNDIGKDRAKVLVDLMHDNPAEFERVMRDWHDDDDSDNMASSFVFGLIQGLGEETAQAVIQAIPSDIKQRLIDFMASGDVYADERSAIAILQQNMVETLAPVPAAVIDQSDWSLEKAQEAADAVTDSDWPRSRQWSREWLRQYHDEPLRFINAIRMTGYNEDYDRAAMYFVYGLYDSLGADKAREVLDRLPEDVKGILRRHLTQDDVYAREQSATDFLAGAPMAVSSQDDSDEQDDLWDSIGGAVADFGSAVGELLSRSAAENARSGQRADGEDDGDLNQGLTITVDDHTDYERQMSSVDPINSSYDREPVIVARGGGANRQGEIVGGIALVVGGVGLAVGAAAIPVAGFIVEPVAAGVAALIETGIAKPMVERGIVMIKGEQ